MGTYMNNMRGIYFHINEDRRDIEEVTKNDIRVKGSIRILR